MSFFIYSLIAMDQLSIDTENTDSSESQSKRKKKNKKAGIYSAIFPLLGKKLKKNFGSFIEMDEKLLDTENTEYLSKKMKKKIMKIGGKF